MSSIHRAGLSDGLAGHARIASPSRSADPSRSACRLIAVVLGATALGACAQSGVVSQRSGISASRQAWVERDRATASAPRQRVAVAHKHSPFGSRKEASRTRTGSQGLASFYSEGSQTASGEKFDAHEFTAAHPTLPFGTKLRVTDVKTGRSVTVRVNDRGPYVQGRVVDVSYSAAEALGMVGKGVADVKLDVVQ